MATSVVTKFPKSRRFPWFNSQKIINWTSTGVTWLAGGALLALFMTDWRAVMGRVPFVRGKFPPIESTEKKDEVADKEDDS